MKAVIVRKKSNQKRVSELKHIIYRLQQFTSIYSPNRTAFRRKKVSEAPTEIRKQSITKASGPAKRLCFDAKVVLSKHNRYIKGRLINISRSGMFVETHMKIFRENEYIKLYINPDKGLGPYTVVAKVVRYHNRPGERAGYGLKFAPMPSQVLTYS